MRRIRYSSIENEEFVPTNTQGTLTRESMEELLTLVSQYSYYPTDIILHPQQYTRPWERDPVLRTQLLGQQADIEHAEEVYQVIPPDPPSSLAEAVRASDLAINYVRIAQQMLVPE